MIKYIFEVPGGYFFMDTYVGGLFIWGRYIGYDGEAFDLDKEEHGRLIDKIRTKGRVVRRWPRESLVSKYLPE